MSAERFITPANILKKQNKIVISCKNVTDAVLILNLNNAHVERVQNYQTSTRWFSRSLITVCQELVNADILEAWERKLRTAQWVTFPVKIRYKRMESGLYWRNGEAYAGATFKGRRVNKLAVFLGQNCNISGRSWNTPLTKCLFLKKMYDFSWRGSDVSSRIGDWEKNEPFNNQSCGFEESFSAQCCVILSDAVQRCL